MSNDLGYDREGTLEQVGDRWRLTFRRRLPHARERVWAALTTPDELAAWFPDEVVGAWVEGATLRFETAVEGIDAFEGTLRTLRPHELVELEWGDDLLRFELVADGDGTILVMTDTFDERGKAARDGAGWHECLDLLEASLAGAPQPFANGERWRDVHPHYVASFGPEGSSVGPPEGNDPRTG